MDWTCPYYARGPLDASCARKGLHQPDVADLHLTIAAEAPRARTAATQLRARQAELRRALLEAGIAAEELTFSSLGIQPVYDDKYERVRGYRAAIDLTATTKSFEALPDLLEVAVAAGATNLTTTRRVLDLPARKREVRDLALAAAKAKAEQTASALGVKLGRITAISESSDDGTGWNGRWNRETVNIAQTAVAAPLTTISKPASPSSSATMGGAKGVLPETEVLVLRQVFVSHTMSPVLRCFTATISGTPSTG